jgi:hypothetical protein
MAWAPSFRPQKERVMDFIRSMQTKDWIIAGVAFLVGAIIF